MKVYPAADAGFRTPQGIAIDATGRVFVANRDFNLVSVIAPSLAVADIPPVQLSAAQQVRGASVFSAGVVQSLFSDADGSTLSYSLVETSSATAISFAIDSVSGAITYLQPTEALANTQTLVIAASDEQGTATSRLTVISEPLSNYPPQFRLSTTANIKQGEDTLQISVTASDDGDSGVDQAITYSISSSNVNFATLTINENSGLITISNVPDAFGRRATVSVTATDSSGASSVQSIVIRGYIISRFAQSASLYAGSGAFGRDDGSTTTARFDTPRGLAYAADGRLFVADSVNNLIRVIDANGSIVSTYAGHWFIR